MADIEYPLHFIHRSGHVWTAETAEQASTQPARMILAKMAARLGSASACRMASGRTSSMAG